MTISQPAHRWDLSPPEARSLQESLRGQIVKTDQLHDVKYVAGTDVAFEKNKTITRAAVAVLRFPSLELEEFQVARRPTSFPYVPGLLSFREIPAVLDAMEKLARLPDLLLVDGQGLAHPRRFGLACHLGFLTALPAIGVAKSRLVGIHDEVPPEKGSCVPLMDRGEIIGAVLRTRDGVRPLYVSIGHKISLETAIKYVMRCVTRYRLPETTRWADRLAAGYEPPRTKKRIR